MREYKGGWDMGELFAPWHLVILLMVASFWGILLVIPFWQIFKKAGMPPPLSLLMIVPLVGFVMLYVLAFSTWKPVQTAYPIDYRAGGGPSI